MPKNPRELFRLLDDPAPLPEHDADTCVLLPDSVLPIQYYSTHEVSPHYRLLLAVLEDAIRCFQRNCDARTGRRRILFREAKEWLFGFDATAFMSCPTVCESLGIDPLMLRRRLREWHIRVRHELNGPRHMRRELSFR
jgi:hypothetical protein